MRESASVKRSMSAAVVLVGLLSSAACSSGSDPSSAGDADRSTTTSDTTVVPGTPQAVIAEGVGVPSLTNDVDLAITLAYTARRFAGVEDLEWASDFVARTTETLRAPEEADGKEVTRDDDAGSLTVLLRLLTDDAPAPDQLAGAVVGERGDIDTDTMVARSIWCDEIPLPEDFVTGLRAAGESGRYELTHALAAVQFMVENRCGDPGELESLSLELARPTAELLSGTGMGDLELEACALLAWTGHRDLLPDGLAERVAQSVLDDGGWPELPGGDQPDSHATAWGLRCQLELSHGSTLEPTRWILD